MKIIIISIIISFLINCFVALKIKKINKTNKTIKHKQLDCNEFINNVIGVKKEEGHYEKIMKTIDQVVFVPGDKPSGIPGAFLVSSKEAQGDPRFPELMDPNINLIQKKSQKTKKIKK